SEHTASNARLAIDPPLANNGLPNRLVTAFEVAEFVGYARARDAGFAEGHAGRSRHVLERAVPLVAVQPVRLGVVRDEQVHPAVAVVVEHRHAEAFDDVSNRPASFVTFLNVPSPRLR